MPQQKLIKKINDKKKIKETKKENKRNKKRK
jgi:hypothetical protein